jgi:hypothetical protein
VLLDVLVGQFGAMQYHRAVFLSEAGRHRQMDLRGIRDAEIMNRERAGVGDDSAPTAPERPAHEVVRVLAREVQILTEAIDATVDLCPVAPLLMEPLGLIGIAGLESLGGGEVAALTAGDMPEPVPGASLGEHVGTLLSNFLIVSFSPG